MDLGNTGSMGQQEPRASAWVKVWVLLGAGYYFPKMSDLMASDFWVGGRDQRRSKRNIIDGAKWAKRGWGPELLWQQEEKRKKSPYTAPSLKRASAFESSWGLRVEAVALDFCLRKGLRQEKQKRKKQPPRARP